MKIIKRNGTKVDFDPDKIITAINSAFVEVDGQLYETDTAADIALDIENRLNNLYPRAISVEEIQNWIEEYLMRSSRPDVARAYIRYRYKRETARKQKDAFMKAVSDKLEAKNPEGQNANVDELSFGGRMGEANRVLTKQYALDFLLSEKSKRNHLNNRIYIHDLDNYSVGNHNCLSIPFDDLLKKGFNTRQADVRTANSINTACQLMAVIFQVQSLQQFGGVSATHMDWTLAPYIRKSFAKHYKDGLKYISNITDDIHPSIEHMINNATEYSIENSEWKAYNQMAYQYAIDLTEREARQGMEGLIHNLNTLQSRSGNQLPFTSVNLGTDTSPEGRMVSYSFLQALINGVGALHKTSIFPCAIFQVMKGVNKEPNTPNYDLYRLALKCTAHRIYPNYANVDWSGNAGYDRNDPRTYFSTMGCRTANGWDVNGLGQLKDGRGNICPVTIILPTIAMEARNKVTSNDQNAIIDEFILELDEAIRDAKDMLLERFEYICEQDPASAKFMYENGLMAGYIPEEGIRSALKHGTLAIGQLGLAEALQILIGEDHTTCAGMSLAKTIEALFKTRCAQYKETYSLNFGVYFTPAENLCHTALKKFKEKYGIIPNVSDKEFFTNSIHVPVWKEMSPFDKIDLEAQLTGYSSAGCITYVELDSGVKNNIDALEHLVNYAMDKDIPYFAINIPIDTCMDCGYTDEMNDTCIECGGDNIQHLRRVTGYLSGDYKKAFNQGKIQETEMRVKHC